MSTPLPEQLNPQAHLRRPVADVVAGLVNDGSAYRVARAAVREAAQRGSRVKFIQVVTGGISVEERQEVDRATFRDALRALRGLPRVPCTFEVIDGDAGPELVERSVGAGLLVVGRDAAAPDRDIARHCQDHAACDVLTVAPIEQRVQSGSADGV
jgi:hypothetical protein